MLHEHAYMRGAWQNGQPRFWHPVKFTLFSTTLGPVEFQSMLVAHAVGITNGQEYGGLYSLYLL